MKVFQVATITETKGRATELVNTFQTNHGASLAAGVSGDSIRRSHDRGAFAGTRATIREQERCLVVAMTQNYLIGFTQVTTFLHGCFGPKCTICATSGEKSAPELGVLIPTDRKENLLHFFVV